jgi:phosphatidylglycerophosphate synthase
MPDEKSSPASAAEFDFKKTVRRMGAKWFLKPFLRINEYVNRPLASPFVRAFVRTRITPIQLTFLALFLGLVGALFFFMGQPSAFVIGGILAQISSVVDCADGMLARARGQQSEFGAFLDMFFDRINEFFLIAGFVLGYYWQSGRILFLLLGSAALGLYFLQTSLFYLIKNYLKDGNKAETAELRGLFMFLIFLFAVINRPDFGIGVLLVSTAGLNAFLIYDLFRVGRRRAVLKSVD